jgi:ABC-type multidrug transport system ATPase subunit
VGALIAVGAGFHPLLTGRENIFVNGAILGMGKQEIEKNFDAIVEFAEVGDFIDTPVKHYSSGMFVRLGFAVAAHCDPDIMLVDEVLAVGDRGFQTRCFKKMGELRDNGTTFVVVSHNMHTVAGFADWVALLHKGDFTRYDSVFEGIRAYTKLFLGKGEEAIERLVSRGGHVEFSDVEVGPRDLAPGQAFTLSARYLASEAYDDIEVDLAVYDTRDTEFYFQATNRAYDRRIDLPKGEGKLTVRLRDLQMNGTLGTVVIAVWAKDRTEQLFWWRVPIEVSGIDHSTGKNFVPVDFEVTT